MSDFVEDGGFRWKKCFLNESCGLHVVRPGKVQCVCDEEDVLSPEDIIRLKLAYQHLQAQFITLQADVDKLKSKFNNEATLDKWSPKEHYQQ